MIRNIKIQNIFDIIEISKSTEPEGLKMDDQKVKAILD